MAEFHLLPGKLLIERDPDEVKIGLILLPDIERKRASTARCILHEPSWAWDEPEWPDLTGKRLVIDKWVGKPLPLSGCTYVVIPERAVLALVED